MFEAEISDLDSGSSPILIKGGRIVTATDDYVADLCVERGQVVAIGEDLQRETSQTIDARGMYVMPGCIDPHVHVETVALGTNTRIVSCDDFSTTTRSAACGGTTTVIHFCFQEDGEALLDALARERSKLDASPPFVDISFHMVLTDLGDTHADEIPHLIEAGISSYKLFMANPPFMVDDSTLFRAMKAAAVHGGLVLVHAENGAVIDLLVREALAEGKTEPKWHAATRPPLAEAEATYRAICFARLAGAPLYVVHVSCGVAVEPIRRARDDGWATFGETCTHYLFIDESALERPDFEGAKYVFTPPPRSRQDQDALWNALASDVLSVVSSDSVPFNWDGHKTLGKENFSKIPAGVPGVEERLIMLHHFGVRTGRLSLNRLVELLATNPAKIFGLYPRKGTIAIGSDADLLVFNPERRIQISAERQQSRVDYNLYEGISVCGAPDVVLVRGQVVVEAGRFVGKPGAGEFVRRARFGEVLPPRDMEGLADSTGLTTRMTHEP